MPEFRGGSAGRPIWGANCGINMGYATSAERHVERPISPSDPDILPGNHDVTELDGADGEEGKGYIWDAALRRGPPGAELRLLRNATLQRTAVARPLRAESKGLQFDESFTHALKRSLLSRLGSGIS